MPKNSRLSYRARATQCCRFLRRTRRRRVKGTGLNWRRQSGGDRRRERERETAKKRRRKGEKKGGEGNRTGIKPGKRKTGRTTTLMRATGRPTQGSAFFLEEQLLARSSTEIILVPPRDSFDAGGDCGDCLLPRPPPFALREEQFNFPERFCLFFCSCVQILRNSRSDSCIM